MACAALPEMVGGTELTRGVRCPDIRSGALADGRRRARLRALWALQTGGGVHCVRVHRTRQTLRVARERLDVTWRTRCALEVHQAEACLAHTGLVVGGRDFVLEVAHFLHNLSALASLPDAARQTARFLVVAEKAEARETHAVSGGGRAGFVRKLVFWTANHVRQRDARLRAVEIAGTKLAQVGARGPEHAGDAHSVAQVHCPRGERAEILIVLRHGTQRLVLADVVQRTHSASAERVSVESVGTSALAPAGTVFRGLFVRRTGRACVVVTPVVVRAARALV